MVHRLWLLPSYLIVFLMVVGVLGAFTELISPMAGFAWFSLGAVVAALGAIALAGAAAFASATGKSWRRSAVRAAVVPLVGTVGLVLGVFRDPAPPINDITTDPSAPPSFSEAPASASEYPEFFAALQSEAYPEIEPILTPDAKPEAFARALATAQAMPDWEVRRSDPESGTIEAVATTRLFRFRDDVAIRVRDEGDGARVDVRSRSRDGQGDLGANAARITAFRSLFEAGVASR